MFYLIYGGEPNPGTTLSGASGVPSFTQQQPDPGFVVKSVPNIFANPNNFPNAYNLTNYENGIDKGREFNSGVCMEIMHFDNVDREFVKSGDGTTYHYTRWTIAASCYVSPQRNDLSFFKGTNLPSILETDITLRNFLKQDRKRLTIIFDSSMETTDQAGTAYQVLLDVPMNGYTIDHEEGPKVNSCNVKQYAGSGGYVVQFVVTVATDDSVSRKFSPVGSQGNFIPLLLSNRWSMTHTGTDEGYLVRNIEGTAVANAPELKRKNIVIDQLRSMIFPPVYPGMRRAYRTEVSSEGTTLMYFITDTQEPMTYIDSVVNPPTAIANAIDLSRTQNSGFSGVYFEGPNDANAIANEFLTKYTFGTDIHPDGPPYSFSKNQSDLWFGSTSRRHVASLTVRHYMGLIRNESNIVLADAAAQAASDYANNSNQFANNQSNNSTNPDPKNKKVLDKSNRVAFNANLASSIYKSGRAADSLFATFVEKVHVECVCRPEGNLKRAFFLALSAAYGLANNTRVDVVDPYTLEVQIDYSTKTVVVDISYTAPDITTLDRRRSGSKKIAIGPQSYLVGGPFDANIKSDFRSVGSTVLNGRSGPFSMEATQPKGSLAGVAAANAFADANTQIFPADANATTILSKLAKEDLPDNGKLLMMDQSQYGEHFPTFGPNGDQISRSFMECFVPLFTAPLTQGGEYPVMLGRAVFPHNTNNGKSTSLAWFYNRASGFRGDSQAATVPEVEKVQKVTWTNRVF